MPKVLIMVRTSTESQSTEDQKRELVEFCKSEGYSEDDIVCVERQGASAAKVDDEYRAMIDQVKAMVDTDKNIRCFAVWHLNRLARTEEVWVEIKSFFVARKVQIICKNPYLRLLDADGNLDPGMELAMGLMAILSKQDQEERKAKFKRAKSAMLKRGEYIGGNLRKYGYKIVDGYFVEDEEEGKVVKLIYDLYSTGTYSSYTLSKELKERGFDVSGRKIVSILSSVAYLGEEVSDSGMHYPQIISRDLFDICKDIRQRNKIDMKRGKRTCLGAKLVKCPVCGATCTSNSKHYICSRHSHHGPCPNGFALRQDVANDLLWRTAYELHMDYLLDLTETKKEEYRKEKEIVDEKIAEAQRKMDDFTTKKDRIVEAYISGLISLKNRDLRLSNLRDEVRIHSELQMRLQGKSVALARMIEDGQKDTMQTFLDAIEKMDTETVFDVVHKHIEKLVARPVSYGKRDKRTHKPNAVEISVFSVYGQEYRYMYFPKYYEKYNLYVWDGRRWVPDRVTTIENQI